MALNKLGVAIKDLFESKGERGTIEVIRYGLQSKKMRPEDFSIREIWEATCGTGDIHEAITSAAFPKLTGELINAAMIEGYEAAPKIGNRLVRRIKSNVQKETFAGLTALDIAEEVGEGMDYNDTTLSEKFVTIDNIKFGQKISVTEETIFFDKTGQIIDRARGIGEAVSVYEERKILRAVLDLDTKSYYPNGVATSFYSSGNGNLIASNPFGATGLENVMIQAQKTKSDGLGTSDDNFINIDLNNAQLIVPVNLVVEAWELANSALVPESAENARNYWQGKLDIMTSPFISTNSSTTWYWGNFAKDFVWTEVWPMQVIAAPATHPAVFDKDIKAIFKGRAYGGCGALDFKHSFKNTA